MGSKISVGQEHLDFSLTHVEVDLVEAKSICEIDSSWKLAYKIDPEMNCL
jgi:hypothetical protein